LTNNVLTPDQIPIRAFFYDGQLVSANTRSLAALSEAGLAPTNVEIIEPTQKFLDRLDETPLIPDAPLPGPLLPLTQSLTDLTINRVVQIPGLDQ
jgi:hypothetical protein